MKLILLALAGVFAYSAATSQNVMINILTQNSGIVKKGEMVFLEVTINNTDPSSYVGIYKIKTQINVPPEIVKIDTAGHVLPTGWTITSNNGSSIILSNGKNMIASNDSRTLLIAIRGIKIGGPSTISGQLSFSNGDAPGTTPGVLAGDNLADNSSTTTIKVQR
jgi:hypothetical protein